MIFRKYMHIERFGNEPVQGIELGNCYIFPKLDGTNASIWSKTANLNFGREIFAGSRTRQLSLEHDNAEFYKSISEKDSDIFLHLSDFFEKYPTLRLYGEWLVPHTLKTYRDDAWKRFWIFDVYNDKTNQYMSYEEYKPRLELFNLDYIPPLAQIKNGSYETFIHILNQNNFFIKNGAGIGEGIVIKNYDFYNKYNEQVWAKIISSEFKEENHKIFGISKYENKMVEEEIVNKYITEALVTKEYAKICNEENGWKSQYIPRLLNTVYYCVVTEEIWNICKEFKDPTINFKTLKSLVINKIKQKLPELF